MQTGSIKVQECKRCHYRSPRPSGQCPICHQNDFDEAKELLVSDISQKAYSYYATQAQILLHLSEQIGVPWDTCLQEIAQKQLKLGQNLAWHLGSTQECLSWSLREAISLQYRLLPQLADQAEGSGQEALAIHLKWLATQQGELVALLAQIRDSVQNS
jgi:hypothetical protein